MNTLQKIGTAAVLSTALMGAVRQGNVQKPQTNQATQLSTAARVLNSERDDLKGQARQGLNNAKRDIATYNSILGTDDEVISNTTLTVEGILVGVVSATLGFMLGFAANMDSYGKRR